MAKSAPHILITGIVRSGTSWLGRALDGGPDTIYLHEPFNPDSAWNAAMPLPSNYIYFDERVGNLYKPKVHRLLTLDPDIKGKYMEGVRADRLDYIKQARTRKGRDDLRCIIKDPTALFATEWLTQNFKVLPVLTLRHPVAICRSIMRLGWGKNLSAHIIARQPHYFATQFSDEVGSELARLNTDWSGFTDLEKTGSFVRLLYLVLTEYRQRHPDWYFVSYEALRDDSDQEFDRLLAHLDIELYPSQRAKISEIRPGNFDPGRAHQQPLDATSITDVFAPNEECSDWRGFYDRFFADLAPAFSDLCNW